RRIAELENELAALENAPEEPEAEQPAAPSGALPEPSDIYTSVSRLRVTMAFREARSKRQQLDELVAREKALAQELHVRPNKPAASAPAVTATLSAAPSNGVSAQPASIAAPP